jgi:hypothetical protein
MTNPTTPFSWQMPTSTDLVTDLPADFETFGQAVATSMADLLGGTTGQILAKNSNTDMDFVWVANDVGDITAVTAGTGISGGGTSGAVTITNSMATAIDAKGDLIAGTGADTFSRIAVGSNTQVLAADSTTSTGLAWVPNSGPTFAAHRTADQSTTQNAYTKIQFTAESFDTANCFDSTTNYRFTPNVAGYYQMQSTITPISTAGDGYIAIFKNGVEHFQFGRKQPQGVGIGGTQIIPMNGTTDYLEVFFFGMGATTGVEGNNAGSGSLFSGTWIRGL